MSTFKFKNIRRSWKNKEVIIFLEQLSLYISSGLPIDRAIAIISEQYVSKREDLTEIRDAIRQGTSFSKIFSKKVPRLHAVISIIEQGEVSGELSKSLHMAQELLERSEDLKKKCLGALTYPLVIGAFSALLTLGLVRGVLPQIIPMLMSLHVKLPLLTRIVIFTSNTISSYGFVIVGSLVVFYLVLKYIYKKFAGYKALVHRVLIQIPLIGPLVKLFWQALFLRTLGSLLASAISPERAYPGAVSGIALSPLRRYLEDHSSKVFEGAQFKYLFSDKKFSFPPYVAALVAAGESSGHLADSLLRSAELIDKDVSNMLKKLTSLLEPTMMAAMGCVVGAIAISIMMPIYDISKVLQR